MRKIVKALPLYVASIIMLVFIAIPHHHHNDFICFTNSHCQQTSEAGKDHEEHKHDPFSGKSGCVSKLFQTEAVKNISSNLYDQVTNHHFTLSLYTLAGFFSFQLFATASEGFPQVRDIAIRQLHLSLPKATRAPPMF